MHPYPFGKVGDPNENGWMTVDDVPPRKIDPARPGMRQWARSDIYVDELLAECIARSVSKGIVQAYPCYLLDFLIWEHHGGPGVGRVLVTWDGLILGRSNEILRDKRLFELDDSPFETSLQDVDSAFEAGSMARRWAQEVPETHLWECGDNEVAEGMLLGVTHDLYEFDAGPKSEDHKDRLYTLIHSGQILRIRGIWLCSPTDPPWLRASLGVRFLADRSLWDRAWACGDSIGTAIAEALAVYPFSPRGCLGLLRTAAELVLAEEARKLDSPFRGQTSTQTSMRFTIIGQPAFRCPWTRGRVRVKPTNSAD
jgi:hypothetical protein